MIGLRVNMSLHMPITPFPPSSLPHHLSNHLNLFRKFISRSRCRCSVCWALHLARKPCTHVSETERPRAPKAWRANRARWHEAYRVADIMHDMPVITVHIWKKKKRDKGDRRRGPRGWRKMRRGPLGLLLFHFSLSLSLQKSHRSVCPSL